MKSPSFSSKFLPPLSTAVEVSKYLQKAIIQGELKPGTRLIERDLVEVLGVSRIPIREAFRILELAGLVKIIPRKGAQVTAFTNHEIEEIYTLRANLVSLAAKLTAEHLNNGILEKMSKICKRMDEKAKEGDVKAYFPLIVEFHSLLARASGNQRLYEILEILGIQTIRYRYTSLSLQGRLKRSNACQQKLMRALEAKDGRTAGRMARQAIEEGKCALIAYLSTHALALELPSWNSEMELPDIPNWGKFD